MIAVIFFKKGPFLVFVGIALHHRWNAGITRLDWFPPFIICLSLKSSTSRLSWLSYNSLKVANLVEETEELLCKLAVTPKTAGLTRAYKGCFAGFEHGSFFFIYGTMTQLPVMIIWSILIIAMLRKCYNKQDVHFPSGDSSSSCHWSREWWNN